MNLPVIFGGLVRRELASLGAFRSPRTHEYRSLLSRLEVNLNQLAAYALQVSI